MQYRKSAARWQQSLIFSRLQRCISGASHLSDGHDEAGLIMWSLTSPFTVLVSRINDLLLHIDFIFSSCILGYIFLELSAFFFSFMCTWMHSVKEKRKEKKCHELIVWNSPLTCEEGFWLRNRGTAVSVTRLQDAVRKRRRRGHFMISAERERDTYRQRERERGERRRERESEWVSCSVFSQQKSLSPVWLLHQRHRPDMSRIACCR